MAQALLGYLMLWPPKVYLLGTMSRQDEHMLLGSEFGQRLEEERASPQLQWDGHGNINPT